MISKGIFYILLAGLSITLMRVCIKLVPHIPVVEMILMRAVFSGVVCYMYIRKNKLPIWGTNHTLLTLRGVFGLGGLILGFYTVLNMPLASATILYYLTPIFISLLAPMFLGEEIGKWQWMFLLVCFGGLFIIHQFDTATDDIFILIGIGAALFAAFAMILVNKLNRLKEDPMVIIFYFSLVTVPVVAIPTAFVWVMPSLRDWIILLLLSLFTQSAQYYMTLAHKHEEANRVSTASFVTIIYNLLLGWFIFDEQFATEAYFGMAIVLVGVIGNVWVRKPSKPST